MWAAIRYRRVQAMVLVLLSALVTTCAVLTPLYTRAMEQSMLRSAVDESDPADSATSVITNRSPTNASAIVPQQLSDVLSPKLTNLHEEPIGSVTAQVGYEISPANGVTQLSLVARDGICEHVRITEGACPTRADEIAISSADRAKWKFEIGQVMPVREKGTNVPVVDLTIVGVYEQVDDPDYWLRLTLGGKSGTFLPGGFTPALDAWITPMATVDDQFASAQVQVQYVLDKPALTLDKLPQAEQGVAESDVNSIYGAVLFSSVGDFSEQITLGQSQARLIVPLLMVQLGLLAVVVLGSVAAAAVDQRRQEIALARLRGRGPRGAGRLVMGELGVIVLAGLPLGFGLALLLGDIGRRVLLAPGVPFEIPWLTWVAMALAGVVALATVALATRPVIREPVSSLLRRVAPTRQRRGFPVLDVMVVALAVAGLVGLATDTVAGPLALLTPTLIALAVGLIASRLWVPIAAAGARRSLARGSVSSALSSWQIARRPVLRKVLTITTVAVALVVFGVNSLLVGDRNRSYRAELEAGAPTVLATSTTDPAALRSALEVVDPGGRTATTVGVIRQRDPRGLATLAVVPNQFSRLAYPSHTAEPYAWADLAAPDVPTLELSGKKASVMLSSSLVLGDADATAGLVLTYASGDQETRELGAVPGAGEPARRATTSLLCPETCRVDAIAVRVETVENLAAAPGTGSRQVKGEVTLADLAVDGEPVDLGGASQWTDAVVPNKEDFLRAAASSEGSTLVLEAANSGNLHLLRRGDVPARLPALLTGSPPPGGSRAAFSANGINGKPMPVTEVQDVPSVPVIGTNAVILNYDVLSRLGGSVDDTARLEVWLDTADPAAVGRITKGLADQGVQASPDRTYAELKSGYDASASAWGLQLAAFVAVLAVLMAALVLLVVAFTSWRAVTRDFSALEMAGVPKRALRRALRLEGILVVVVGAVLGAASGVAGGILAMPLIPLFNQDPVAPARDLGLATGPVAIAVLAALAILVAVALLVAQGMGRRMAFDRVRDQL